MTIDRKKIIVLLVIFMVIGSSLKSAPLISEGEDSYYVDNGQFKLIISKTSGMITSAKLKESNIELVSDYGDYSIFFPEFAVQHREGTTEKWYCPASYGNLTSELIVNTDSIGILRCYWETGLIDTKWDYKFTKEKPFFVVTIERTVRKANIYANAQQCVMYTPDMDDSYIVNYEGKLYPTMQNGISSGPTAWTSEHSMFSAMDEGLSTRYPAIVWHDRDGDITTGIIITYVSPNQRETISYHGGGRSTGHPGYGEGQINWFGKSDSESLLLKEGTIYSIEIYYYLDYGSVDRFDNFNKALLNETHYDSVQSENYFAASWGGRRCASLKYCWNFPQASNNFICSQQLFKHRAISIPGSQNGIRDSQVFNLSVKANSLGKIYDLTPIGAESVAHKYASNICDGDSMIGKMVWDVNGLESELSYKMYDDSDKLIVRGKILPPSATTKLKELYVELKFSPRVNLVNKLNFVAYDIICEDSVYDTIGITVYNFSGTTSVLMTDSTLILYLVDNATDSIYSSNDLWEYTFCLFPHKGGKINNIADITSLHSMPINFYREYYKTLPTTGIIFNRDNEMGICPNTDIFVYDVSLNLNDTLIAQIKLYANPGLYPIKILNRKATVKKVAVNDSCLSENDWNYNSVTKVLEIIFNWNGLSTINIYSTETVGIEEENCEYSLVEDSPNPFTTAITIRYQVITPGRVTIKIYNALGQLIKIIDDCEKEAGFYICQWDGKNESEQEIENGVYFCQIKSQACNVSKKIVLLR